MRQTGGMALGETSTRSRPRSRAIFSASKGWRIPSCSPFSSMTRISRARIRSLMRMKDLAARLSNAMVLLRKRAWQARAGRPMGRSEATQPEYSIGPASLKKEVRGWEGRPLATRKADQRAVGVNASAANMEKLIRREVAVEGDGEEVFRHAG